MLKTTGLSNKPLVKTMAADQFLAKITIASQLLKRMMATIKLNLVIIV